MKQLIENRKKNYFNEDYLMENENKIIAEVDNLESILLKQNND